MIVSLNDQTSDKYVYNYNHYDDCYNHYFFSTFLRPIQQTEKYDDLTNSDSRESVIKVSLFYFLKKHLLQKEMKKIGLL